MPLKSLTSILSPYVLEAHQLLNGYEIPAGIFAYLILGRMHMFRYIRRYTLPIVGLGIFCYRLKDTNDNTTSNSFLTQIALWLESLKFHDKNLYKKFFINITGDILGLSLCSSL